MSSYTVFPNAPITEALLDIRVELPETATLEVLEKFQEKIKARFPEKQQRVSYRADFKLTPEGPSAEVPFSGPDGYFFQSSKDKKIVQVRLDGFTFNKLKPYEKWEALKSEARELWDIYYKIAKPVRITRIALRYINRIEIPLPVKTFKDYILTVPEIAPGLPQGLSQFFMQLVIPSPDIEATAIINQTMESPNPNQRLPFIFDIDAYRDVSYSGNESDMWDAFEKLRDFKNQIFFNSTTDKAKELFK